MANVFPVPGGKYTDDFSANRRDTGKHGGIDIFAPRGTPVYAIEDGTITKMGWNKLGGNRLWINKRWYYAHLEKYAPGLKAGMKVKAGQLLGYVGTTGNAKGTPPHLHLGYAPSGGTRWENPYPILQQLKTGGGAPAPQSGETTASTEATDSVDQEAVRQAAIGESIGSVRGAPTPASTLAGAEVGFPGSAPAVLPEKPPPIETWKALSTLENVSPDTQRYLSLALLAEGE